MGLKHNPGFSLQNMKNSLISTEHLIKTLKCKMLNDSSMPYDLPGLHCMPKKKM